MLPELTSVSATSSRMIWVFQNDLCIVADLMHDVGAAKRERGATLRVVPMVRVPVSETVPALSESRSEKKVRLLLPDLPAKRSYHALAGLNLPLVCRMPPSSSAACCSWSAK